MLTRKTRKGDTITLTYDTLNRLSTKAAPSEPTVAYAYDLASHLIGVSDNSAAIATPSTAETYTTNYTYDALNRPTNISWFPAQAQSPPASSADKFTYAYDATNRRISQTTATGKSWWNYPTAAASIAYTANNLDQYSAVGSVTPTYDGNGNLSYDGSFTYCYDAESRLTSILSAGTCASQTTTVATYAYDAQGRRKTKTVGSATTDYATDADNREVLEYNGASGSGALLRWYAFGRGPDEVLNQMSVMGSGTRATLIPDIQGSLIGSLDAASGTLTKTGYQPFGQNASLTPSTQPGFYYTARRFDPETAGSTAQPSGLYYYRARMYAPTWGRFLQADPVGYAAGANLYAYVGNDPLNRTDPSGQDLIGVAVGAVFGAYYGALGAAFQPGASATSIVIAAAAGAGAGFVVGAFDISFGVGTLAVVGAVAGGAGDIAGQVATNYIAGKPIGNINYGSTAGAVLGGAIGGGYGTALSRWAPAAIPKVLTTIGATSITSGPGLFLTGIGAALGLPANRRSDESIPQMEQVPIFLARLAILPLVPVEIGLFAWYFLYWDLFPKYSVRRIIPWLILLVSTLGIPLLQIFIYRSITSITKIDDLYLAFTVVAESLLSVALGFYLLVRRRSRDRRR